jgi:hypothetical protein
MNCILKSDIRVEQMNIFLEEHHSPTVNKTHKLHCNKCEASVGIMWTDSNYTGPMLKAADVKFVGTGFKGRPASAVNSWRKCNFLASKSLGRSEFEEDDEVPAKVVSLPAQEKRFQDILGQFNDTWRLTDEKKFSLFGYFYRAEVTSIYEVKNHASYQRFESYKESKRQQGHPPCVKRLWHGMMIALLAGAAPSFVARKTVPVLYVTSALPVSI